MKKDDVVTPKSKDSSMSVNKNFVLDATATVETMHAETESSVDEVIETPKH